MLKSIDKIKGLGVYQNYSKPADTQEFGIKNLIYGWNYSGKTTLSRLFAQLEAKTANPDLSGCEFSFSTDSDAITEKNFNRCNVSVRVFNSDFIKANLHFDDLLDRAREVLTEASANMLANTGEDLAIDDIASITGALAQLADSSVVRNAAADALQGFILGIDNKLADVSSSQELNTFREELVSFARAYGVDIDETLTRDLENRRDALEDRENEADEAPYQHIGPQAGPRDISDLEIKSMFSMVNGYPGAQ